MNNPAPPPSGINWLTGSFLSLVVFLCLILIGSSGYMKYQLDRSEAVLAAPESALPSDQDATVKLRRALGYSGFVGAAQNFLSTRDHGAVNDMKVSLKAAQDTLNQLPEKAPPEARRDLQSILDIFAAAAAKAEQSTNDASVGFSSTDLAPLYAALPILDQRSEAAMATGRFAAQSNVKLWATLLTLVAWISLIMAAACASGIYLSLRGRHAAPLRALAQSVQNMARGDMRTPIWGMERQDIVGDLARSVDLARYHFSQLPDMSLISEQGPMRIRFEGKARSLFEAMMQNITRDSEGIRSQASSLADAVNHQKETATQVSAYLGSVISTMNQERQNRDQQAQQLLTSVVGSAQSLHGAQQAAEVQLNHLIAYLEERARGLAEVTQITGRQVAQTLQSLSLTEHNLRSSAEQNQETVRRLASSTNDLGEQLFGAVSLLRAGGKVLTETAENTQSRLNEAISLLSQSEGSLRAMLVQGFEPVGHLLANTSDKIAAREEETKRMQAIISGFEAAQHKLEEYFAQQTQVAGAQTENLTVTLDDIGSRLEQRIAESLSRAENTMQGLNKLSEISEQMGAAVERLAALEAANQAATEGTPDNLLLEIKSGFEVTTRSLARLREEFIGAALNGQTLSSAPAATEEASPAALQSMVEQVVAANGSLASVITQQSDRIETRLAGMDKKINAGGSTSGGGMSADDAQAQLRQQAQVLSELATALGSIDAHMQEMRALFKNREQKTSPNDRMAS